MKILVLGGGGREHAIVWGLSKSRLVKEIHCAPGNPGIAQLATLHSIDIVEPEAVVALAKKLGAELVVCGPEAPLVAGAGEALRKHNIAVFGPDSDGARLEGSKAYAKAFMARHGVASAPYDICRNIAEAKAALKKRNAPFVVKADGLAAGKGAFVLETIEKAEEVCNDLLENKSLGKAGQTLVIEDYLPGWELTVLAITDGKDYRILPASQDHKRAFDGNKGPNTGGMGAFAPVALADKTLMKKIEEKVVIPTINGLAADGVSYRGVIYCSIMVVDDEPFVIEYNVRFGDPEAQAVIPAIDLDWAEVFMASASGRLSSVNWPVQKPLGAERHSLAVVLASGGYPEQYDKGYTISGLNELESMDGVLVFHAGTELNSKGEIISSGGRVLTIVGSGSNLDIAYQTAYKAISFVSFEKAFYRRDIGGKALSALPRVGIIIGSASDLPIAKEASDVLKDYNIAFEITVASAHRSPDDVVNYAKNASSRGLKLLIAMAGLSAALPGVLAAHTELPVLGVPVGAGSLGGLDALLSIAQMPPGVPVGSLGIGSAKNAALLAIRCLGLMDLTIAEKLKEAQKSAASAVVSSRAKLELLPQPPLEAFLPS